MKKFAAVFPGQGSQSVGMFADLMDEKVVADVYAEASDALGYDLKALTLNGPESELNKTEITQPAILTASVAAYRLFTERSGAIPAFAAGHSLGEYSALVCAGSIAFSDAVKLVRVRGKAMQEAVPAGQGSMAAVLGVSDEDIEKGCEQVRAKGLKVWAANFNTPGQVVISGAKDGVDAASEYFSANGAKRVVALAVSAPSHCPLMQSAADKLKEELDSIEVKNAAYPVYANFTAAKETDAAAIKKALLAQLTGPVRWAQSVQAMASEGVGILCELGPSRVLSGMLRRIDKSLTACNVCDKASLEKAVAALSE